MNEYGPPPFGISCMTRIPIRSQSQYHRRHSVFACFLSILKPISLIASSSLTIIASSGYVTSPSQVYPWSSSPLRNSGLPLSINRRTLYLSVPAENFRIPK